MSEHAHNLRRLRRARPVGEVRDRLEALVRTVDRGALVAGDPVELVHAHADPHDQEVAGLLVAGLAYGRVQLIRERARAALEALGPSPAAAANDPRALEALCGFAYRFQRGDDLPRFLAAVGRVRRAHGSLAACFAGACRPGDADYAEAAGRFVAEVRRAVAGPETYGLRYLLPDPATGGAAKRLFLYLRWMVRGPDGLDLGTWRALEPRVHPRGLVVPLDTHMSRIARYLGFTRRKTDDLRAAREITRRFAELDPEDPVRFDMALCHLGITGRCPRQLDLAKCASCPIGSVCRVTAKRVRRPRASAGAVRR